MDLIVRLPFVLIGRAGFDGQKAESSLIGRTFKATGGMMNPEGAKNVYASFDEMGRYLRLEVGNDEIFDIDCRDKWLQRTASFNIYNPLEFIHLSTKDN